VPIDAFPRERAGICSGTLSVLSSDGAESARMGGVFVTTSAGIVNFLNKW